MSPEVIVIGGGFAGLSAATSLAERGVSVVLLEARPSLGGRASAFTDPATGERVDNGQHVFFGSYHETFRFLRRVGAEANVGVQRLLAVDIVDREGKASHLRCPPLPAPLHLLAGVLRWKALPWRDRITVVRVGREILRMARTPGGAAAMAHGAGDTVREWLVRHGQTAGLIELLWEPLAVAALNESIDVAAAPPFVAVLERLFGRRPLDSALGLPVKPLDECYAVPASRFITSRGGVVRTDAPALILPCEPAAQPSASSAPPRLRVRVRDREVSAAAVVCAVAWHALPALFVDPPAGLADVLAAAERTAASPIVTINLWFDRRVSSAPFVGLPGRAAQWVFDKRALFGEASSHLSVVSSGAAALVGRTNDELVALARAEVAAALPLARTAVLRRAVVVRERRATFSVAPGQPPRPATRTAIPGLFLAGDWIDTGLPATIESAVTSGHWAADAATELLRQRAE